MILNFGVETTHQPIYIVSRNEIRENLEKHRVNLAEGILKRSLFEINDYSAIIEKVDENEYFDVHRRLVLQGYDIIEAFWIRRRSNV